MDADYDLFEIVKVIREFWLFDAESYQRKYRNTQDRALIPSYYVVTWPETSRIRRFDEHSSFHGPFKLSQEAQAFRDAMQKHKYGLIPLSTRWSLTTPNP